MMYRFNDVENFYFLAMPCIRACTASIVACSFMYFHICLLISCCFILCLFSVFWNTVFQKSARASFISALLSVFRLCEKNKDPHGSRGSGVFDTFSSPSLLVCEFVPALALSFFFASSSCVSNGGLGLGFEVGW
jgi:hypothetical protein